MSGGEGFARRVTLANLHLFAPLLGKRRDSNKGASGDSPDEATNDAPTIDPELAAAKELFQGVPFSTRGQHSTSGGDREAPAGRRRAGADEALPAGTEGQEELLMRIRPRRDGTQVQLSMVVHASAFMNSVMELTSSSDGSRKPLGFDLAGANDKRNNLRFEAPELAGMTQPVARFRWISENGGRALQYEIFDAAASTTGREILTYLEQGIANPASTKLTQVGQVETVLSKPDKEAAQWYRLHPFTNSEGDL